MGGWGLELGGGAGWESTVGDTGNIRNMFNNKNFFKVQISRYRLVMGM